MAKLSAELLVRMERDQRARAGLPPSADAVAWAHVHAIDADNTAWLRSVLDEHGWPRRSEIGEEAGVAAWLLAQHADLDRDFQVRCLDLLQEAVRNGEADPRHLAYLTDRVRLAFDKPQVYGTQFQINPLGPWTLYPIEDEAGLDERRQAVGLEPFADYERQMKDRRRGAQR
jgi:hypothetical protein